MYCQNNAFFPLCLPFFFLSFLYSFLPRFSDRLLTPLLPLPPSRHVLPPLFFFPSIGIAHPSSREKRSGKSRFSPFWRPPFSPGGTVYCHSICLFFTTLKPPTTVFFSVFSSLFFFLNPSLFPQDPLANIFRKNVSFSTKSPLPLLKVSLFFLHLFPVRKKWNFFFPPPICLEFAVILNPPPLSSSLFFVFATTSQGVQSISLYHLTPSVRHLFLIFRFIFFPPSPSFFQGPWSPPPPLFHPPPFFHKPFPFRLYPLNLSIQMVGLCHIQFLRFPLCFVASFFPARLPLLFFFLSRSRSLGRDPPPFYNSFKPPEMFCSTSAPRPFLESFLVLFRDPGMVFTCLLYPLAKVFRLFCIQPIPLFPYPPPLFFPLSFYGCFFVAALFPPFPPL